MGLRERWKVEVGVFPGDWPASSRASEGGKEGAPRRSLAGYRSWVTRRQAEALKGGFDALGRSLRRQAISILRELLEAPGIPSRFGTAASTRAAEVAVVDPEALLAFRLFSGALRDDEGARGGVAGEDPRDERLGSGEIRAKLFEHAGFCRFNVRCPLRSLLDSKLAGGVPHEFPFRATLAGEALGLPPPAVTNVMPRTLLFKPRLAVSWRLKTWGCGSPERSRNGSSSLGRLPQEAYPPRLAGPPALRRGTAEAARQE